MQVGMGMSTKVEIADTGGRIDGSGKPHINEEISKELNKGPVTKSSIIEKEREYTEDELVEAIDLVNEEFIIYDRRFERGVHERSNRVMVKVIDTLTDEVIREIPPEKILDAMANICELAGIIVDERI